MAYGRETWFDFNWRPNLLPTLYSMAKTPNQSAIGADPSGYAQAKAQDLDQQDQDPEVRALLEVLMSQTKLVLMEMEALRDQSTHHCAELTGMLSQLRSEHQALRRRHQEVKSQLQEYQEMTNELWESKSAQESRERQAQKLTRHL